MRPNAYIAIFVLASLSYGKFQQQRLEAHQSFNVTTIDQDEVGSDWKLVGPQAPSFTPPAEQDLSAFPAFQVPAKKTSISHVQKVLKESNPLAGTEYDKLDFIWVFSTGKKEWWKFKRQSGESLYANTLPPWDPTAKEKKTDPGFVPPAGTDATHFSAFQQDDPSKTLPSVGKAKEALSKGNPLTTKETTHLVVFFVKSTRDGRYWKFEKNTGSAPPVPKRGASAKKSILIQGGCFCPPHKGHFANTQNLYSQFDEIYIGAFKGSVYRHGYKVQDNINMWNVYKNLLPGGGAKIKDVMEADGEPYFVVAKKLSMSDKVHAGDTVKIIVGDDYTPRRQEKIKTTISEYLPQATVEVVVEARSKIAVSATKMCQSIDTWWTKSHNWGGDFTPINDFLPPELLGKPQLLQSFKAELKKKTKEG